jgi:hypothetical protein
MIPEFHRMIKNVHHVYTHREINDVLEILSHQELPRDAIPQISRDMGIPRQALRDWYSQRSQEGDQDWFPLTQGHPPARALSNATETGIADFVRVNYIWSGKRATRGLLQSPCLHSCMLYEEDERHRERFAASNTFLRGFERRQGLSLRTRDHERRSKLGETYVDHFLGRLNSLSNDYPLELIFDMDETCWRLFQTARKVLAEKGSDTVKLESTPGQQT